MIRHISKLIWNRKRSNLLIISEVMVTFLVVFAVIATGFYSYHKYKQPLGFSIERTWQIRLETGAQWQDSRDRPVLKSLVETLRQQPEIRSVGMTSIQLFENSSWSSTQEIEGRNVEYLVNMVNQEGPRDWGVELVAGRWFDERDVGQAYTAIMVNRRFIQTIGIQGDPVGFEFGDPDSPETPPKRIVGIFSDFRQRGDFSDLTPYVFYRYDLDQEHRESMNQVHITFHQDMPAAYEEILLKQLKAVAPLWEFEIHPWKHLRENHIRMYLMPLILLAVVVGFLLLMVAMGLFGVLWQNITRRTREIGLRRALGASRSSIQLQIIGEMVVLTLFSVTIAMVLLVQFPLLNLVPALTWANFVVSSILAISTMLAIVILCALYPSLAANVMPPAEALHYE